MYVLSESKQLVVSVSEQLYKTFPGIFDFTSCPSGDFSIRTLTWELTDLFTICSLCKVIRSRSAARSIFLGMLLELLVSLFSVCISKEFSGTTTMDIVSYCSPEL